MEIKKWLNEEADWVDSKEGFNAVAAKILTSKNRFLILNFEQAREFYIAIRSIRFNRVIIDEAHKLRNPETKLYKGVKEFIKHLPHSYLFFLTGTPLVNRPTDLWALLHLIDPDRHTNKKNWLNAWFYMYGSTEYRHKSKEAFQNMISKYMLRRERKEVLELPPVRKITKPIELEGLQKKMYDQMMVEWMAAFGQNESVTAACLLAQITRLKQICLAPTLITGAESCDGIKTEELIDLLEEAQGKVVITSGYSRYLHPLKKRLEQEGHVVGMITGLNQDEIQRAEQVKEFQNPNSPMNLFLISHGAGGESLTLTAANNFVYMDKPWTAASEDQLFGRVYRIGQDKKVYNYYLKAMDTVEEYIEGIILRKRALFNDSVPMGLVKQIFFGKGN